MRYKGVFITGKAYQGVAQRVRTKMSPPAVCRVGIRRKPKRSKLYRYFCLWTTGVTLESPQLVEHYRQRGQIETAFRYQHFGFSGYPAGSKRFLICFVGFTSASPLAPYGRWGGWQKRRVPFVRLLSSHTLGLESGLNCRWQYN